MGVAESTVLPGDEDARFSSGDHYIVLGVSEDASSNEIRSAFRKAALLHHPDKNVDDMERATQRFSALQAAYEVLSDDQKRMLYDAQRAFKEPYIPTTTEEFTSKMPGFWEPEKETPPAASGPRDTPRNGVPPTSSWSRKSWFQPRDPFPPELGPIGFDDLHDFHHLLTPELLVEEGHETFYKLYRRIFIRIAQDEPNGSQDMPEFGDASSPWALRRRPAKQHDGSVRAFYTFWVNFETSKDFTEEIALDIPPDASRKTRKRAQAERRKIGHQIGMEYNRGVRSLAMMIRSVDPRYVCRNSPCACMGCYARAMESRMG
ncbi:DnaJ-domain-containing protein [Laetiporus sulphureus 93-53]|uniref:DnaJ-domain-containing protein n=1 Tax=Laetiporus sulphureus 93-53 TaxID=1314785 RepID=A0A165GLJ8_9APHY|nr:DnaJ-domain-containing protein [Laetiporus sulphureus 93-53]KZT10519.1 DnaJ-domain-containing protein [Laetiporus sulphureus 93-53]